MSNVAKTLERVLAGKSGVKFQELHMLLIALGFGEPRVSGSHHIYVHPKVSLPVNIQPFGKEAKKYQVRQVSAIIREFKLELGEQ